MKMDQLFQFVEIVRAGSINKAAQKLFISQSTLSLSIRALETELGARLFFRKSNGVELTELGEEFLKQTEPLCEQFQNLGMLCEKVQEKAPRLHLAVFYTGYIARAFTRLVKMYAAQNPDFSILEATFTRMTELVVSGSCELAVYSLISTSRLLCLNHLKQNGLSFQPLCKMNAYIMLRDDHPVLDGGCGSLSMDMLEEYPYTSSPDKLSQTDWIVLTGKPQRNMRHILTCSRENMTDLILSTNAFSIVPFNNTLYASGLPYQNGAIRMVPIDGPGLDYELGFIWRRSVNLSPPALDYIGFLKEELGIQ